MGEPAKSKSDPKQVLQQRQNFQRCPSFASAYVGVHGSAALSTRSLLQLFLVLEGIYL